MHLQLYCGEKGITMKHMLAVLTLILMMLAVAASADVVTVTPVSEVAPVGQIELGETQLSNGWSIVTNAKGWAKLSTFGPASYFARNMSGKRFIAGSPEVSPDQDLGRGTFYATCDMSYGWQGTSGNNTPSTCWLGTDTWNGATLHGKTLGSISNLDYYSFVDKCPTRCTKGKTEMYWWADATYSFWNGPMQPIQLQLVVESPDGSEVRTLWYRPWGTNYDGDDLLDEPGSKKGRWQRLRPMTQGMWYMPATGTTPNTVEQGWANWSTMLAFQLPDGPMPAFSQWKLADPTRIGKTPGWDPTTIPPGSPTTTGTGCPLNFFVGARKTSVNPLFFQGNIKWYNKAYGERAQMDYFTLGFNAEGTETYDFEPLASDPEVQTVALAEAALKHPIASLDATRKHYLVKITGKVQQTTLYRNQGFVIEDGSAITYTDPGYSPNWTKTTLPGPVRIWLLDDPWNGDPLWISPGDTVTAEGMVEPLRFASAPTDLMVMWTNINKLRVH